MDIKEENKNNDHEEKVKNGISGRGLNNKKNLIAVVAIIAVSFFLFIVSTHPVSEKYTNGVNGYSFEFIPDAQTKLVVEGSIPDELKKQGVKTMQDMQLTAGDTLILRGNLDTNQTAAYTIIELSGLENYLTYTDYVVTLRANLDALSQATSTSTSTSASSTVRTATYTENETVVGPAQIPATQFLSEVEVIIDPQTLKQGIGVFHDTMFEADDKAYLISVRYLKENKDSQDYADFYNKLLASFTYDKNSKNTQPIKLEKIKATTTAATSNEATPL